MGDFIGRLGGTVDPAHPALGILAGAAVKAAVILAGALVISLALRRASAATRHLVWSAAIAAALLVPVAGAVLPAWRVPVPGLDAGAVTTGDAVAGTAAAARATDEAYADAGAVGAVDGAAAGVAGSPNERATSHAAVRGAGAARRATTGAERGGDGPSTRSAVSAIRSGAGMASVAGGPAVSARDGAVGVRGGGGSESPAGAPWGVIALLVWAAGAAVVAAGVVVGLARLRRLVRRSRPAEDGRVHDRAEALSGRLGLRKAPTVLRGRGSTMPMTWGVARGVVFLPAEADEWSDERLDAVLLHELAHVRRRDYLVQLAADIACALYWFNPLAWLAARRLRVEREHACDDQVLFAGTRPSTYAAELLELARSLRPARATAFAAMSMARPSQLTGRLLAVLDEDRARRVVSRRLAASIALAAAAVLVPLAALTPAARAEAAEEPAAAADAVAAGPLDPTARSRPSAPSSTSAEAAMPAAVDAPMADASTVPVEHPGTAAVDVDADREMPPVSPTPDVGAADAPPLRRGAIRTARLPAAVDPCWEADPERVSIRRSGDDDRDTIEWRADDCEIEARVEGRVRFRGDFRSIASISPGGLFRLEEDDGEVRRRLEIRPGADGGLEYEWSVDGDRRPFDAAARVWYERTLTTLLRRTGYAAEERVAWLLDRGGVDTVLQDIEDVTNDFVQARYLTELLKQTDPDAGELVRVVALAGVRLDSDFELARLLGVVADEHRLTDEMRRAFIEASRTIGSDFERARVLRTALEGENLREADVSALIDAAAEIDSDFELARLLIAVGGAYTLGPEVQAAYLGAARSIGSDFERRRVFDALLEQDGLTPRSVADIVDASATIGSDFELSRLLQASAKFDLSSPAVRRSYFAAARTIGSDFELKRVLTALLDSQATDDELIREVLTTAQSIDSDFELASLLVDVADRHRLTGDLRALYVRAVESIGSTHEMRRAYTALVRQARDGT